MLLLPVLLPKANLPFLVTTIQHTADCKSGTEALRSLNEPWWSAYEETALALAAPPNASLTMRIPRLLNENPNGVMPDEA